MNDKKILVVVPARGGSKGVKRKNTRILGNKPLILWTLDSARASKYIDKIIVSTEDKEIKDICIQNNIEVIDRPLDLAQDNSSINDTVMHALEVLKNREYIPDYVMLLQCTTPFRTTKNIDEAISRYLLLEEKYESLISVEFEEYPPYWLKKVDECGKITDFLYYDKNKLQRRQDFEKVYKLNGAIFLTKLSNYYKNYCFESNNSIAYIMDKINSIDIDTEEDFKYAEYISQTIDLN